MELKRQLIQGALELGFIRARVAGPTILEGEGERLSSWLGRGFQGAMAWLGRGEGRADPGLLMEGVRSILVVAAPIGGEVRRPPGLAVARYARGRDYHGVVAEGLSALAERLLELAPGVRHRAYVDSAPVLEKALARRAGLGFVGKNSLLITPEAGSQVVLGELAMDLELEPDGPVEGDCGECRECLKACPTGALVAPYLVDSRRCIAYLTVEHRGEWGEPRPSRPWLFGCDLCQEACPHNQISLSSPSLGTWPSHLPPGVTLDQTLTSGGFKRAFKGTAIVRCRVQGWKRNVAWARSISIKDSG